jgi:general secretion pathway protein H
MARKGHSRGFTLVELMIVIGVIALVTAAVLPGLATLTGANARQAAGELSGALRYLFDTAALRHVSCRMVLDLDERAYWAECAEGKGGVDRSGDEALSEEELKRRFPDEEDAERRRALARSRFGAYADRLLPKRTLPGKTGFGEVVVEGRKDPVEKGRAYVHFFPGGRAQRAYVPVVDGKNLYTIVVEPFSGRAKVTTGRVDARIEEEPR